MSTVRSWVHRFFFALLLVAGGTTFWWMLNDPSGTIGPDSGIELTGHLPPQDLKEIKRLVGLEIRNRGPGANWRQILTSLQRIRHWREEIREREHIRNIDVNPDGTVSVGTGGSVMGFVYELKKAPSGWHIVQSRLWATTGIDFDDGFGPPR